MSGDGARQRLMRAQAEWVFGNADKAHRWLSRPLEVLDGQRPIQLAETEAGERAVATLLDKIAWGAAA